MRVVCVGRDARQIQEMDLPGAPRVGDHMLARASGGAWETLEVITVRWEPQNPQRRSAPSGPWQVVVVLGS